jgi:putative flippase GtrA
MSVTRLPPTVGPRPLFERLACSLGVSVATTLVSTGVLVLLVLGSGVPAGRANAIGVLCGIPLSYVGNRRWVWRRSGRSALGREVLPFAAMCVLGLVASTAVVGRVGTLTAAFPASWRAVILPIASAATFGALWVVQFVLLDRLIFRTRATRARSTDRSTIEASRPPVSPATTAFANASGGGGR